GWPGRGGPRARRVDAATSWWLSPESRTGFAGAARAGGPGPNKGVGVDVRGAAPPGGVGQSRVDGRGGKPKVRATPAGQARRGRELSIAGGAAFWLQAEQPGRCGLSLSGWAERLAQPAGAALLPGSRRPG